MPVRYVIDPQRQRIHTTCDGFVTFEEVCQHFEELRRNPEFRERLDVLLDLTSLTSIPTAEQLRGVVEQVALTGGRWRFGACAIIAADEALFGVVRFLEVYAIDVFTGTKVFRIADEGERWLASLEEMKKDSR
ncbi:MAG TPA: hypothetical protein VGM54_01085 [Chthoniobacter sp.]|jgi:hypothetical protein